MTEIHLSLPVEWAICLDAGADPADAGWDAESFEIWLSENSHLRFVSINSFSFDTRDHVHPGQQGRELVCRSVLFESPSYLSNVRKRRISVPDPTKIPFPKGVKHA
jgi:hypothetical protein